MGLLTGISLISGMEILYFMAKILLRMIREKFKTTFPPGFPLISAVEILYFIVKILLKMMIGKR